MIEIYMPLFGTCYCGQKNETSSAHPYRHIVIHENGYISDLTCIHGHRVVVPEPAKFHNIIDLEESAIEWVENTYSDIDRWVFTRVDMEEAFKAGFLEK